MAESIFEEIMCENFPNLKEDMNISIQETQWTPSKIKFKETHSRTHYNQTFKRQKQRILKTARKKWFTNTRELQFDYKKISHQKQAWELRGSAVQNAKKKQKQKQNCQARILDPEKLSFKSEEDIKTQWGRN